MNQIKIKYDTSAVVLPGRVVKILDRASMSDLKVLLTLCASPELCRNFSDEDWHEQVSKLADCDTETVKNAIAFWRGAGILTIEASSSAKKAKDKNGKDTLPTEEKAVNTTSESLAATQVIETVSEEKKTIKLRSKDEIPHYTTEQLVTLLETHEETAAWLNECQRIFGKIFKTVEVNIILGFVDYLGLDWEYVLCLLAHYVTIQERRQMSKSIRGVEKMAFDLYDRGIMTLPALQEEIRREELLADSEGKLRTLFGMGDRSLTAKEKKCFSTWIHDYQYGIDIIRMAYEVTVDTKGSPNISYMNSVLANWNKDGLRTPEAIRSADEAYKNAANGKRKKQTPSPAGSFDTDDFFAAAVRRSFGDEDPSVKTKKD